jgi:ADP-ribosylglycohydrolase
MQTELSRIQGCLFGLAFGDALGAPTEFLSVDEILSRWPPDGPWELYGNPAHVTDDTQMTIAVGEALLAAKASADISPASLEDKLRNAFVEWFHSPENNRAPGMTCLRACARLEEGMTWIAATETSSKGCGANMRVAPVGLLDIQENFLNPSTRSALAQFQSALTHGHPTALAASDLTAFTINYLAKGEDVASLTSRLREYAISQQLIYYVTWLGSLWEQPGVESPEGFISRGWQECLEQLYRLEEALIHPDYETDPCLLTGAGWVAEEAFSTGLYCFLLYSDNPLKALQRAAVTSGDSDSIACLTGAFAGASLGIQAWSDDWVQRIEYRERLLHIADGLSF